MLYREINTPISILLNPILLTHRLFILYFSCFHMSSDYIIYYLRSSSALVGFYCPVWTPYPSRCTFLVFLLGLAQDCPRFRVRVFPEFTEFLLLQLKQPFMSGWYFRIILFYSSIFGCFFLSSFKCIYRFNTMGCNE